jgi:methionine sulfoxide reductase catalytic subunit
VSITRSPHPLRYSDVTPRRVYLNRRRFLAAGAATAGSLALPSARATTRFTSLVKTPYNVGNEALTSQQIVTTYNNFYEFGTGKDELAQNAPRWKPDPTWKVRIEGEVTEAKTLDLDQILKPAPLEERIYPWKAGRSWCLGWASPSTRC